MLSRILVPIDRSRHTPDALRTAICVARREHACLRFVHVNDARLTVEEGEEPFSGTPDEAIAAIARAGNRLLEGAERAAASSGVECDGVLFDRVQGTACDLVASEVRRWRPDLVVLPGGLESEDSGAAGMEQALRELLVRVVRVGHAGACGRPGGAPHRNAVATP